MRWSKTIGIDSLLVIATAIDDNRLRSTNLLQRHQGVLTCRKYFDRPVEYSVS